MKVFLFKIKFFINLYDLKFKWEISKIIKNRIKYKY